MPPRQRIGVRWLRNKTFRTPVGRHPYAAPPAHGDAPAHRMRLVRNKTFRAPVGRHPYAAPPAHGAEDALATEQETPVGAACRPTSAAHRMRWLRNKTFRPAPVGRHPYAAPPAHGDAPAHRMRWLRNKTFRAPVGRHPYAAPPAHGDAPAHRMRWLRNKTFRAPVGRHPYAAPPAHGDAPTHKIRWLRNKTCGDKSACGRLSVRGSVRTHPPRQRLSLQRVFGQGLLESSRATTAWFWADPMALRAIGL
jgi:hypothetical protein